MASNKPVSLISDSTYGYVYGLSLVVVGLGSAFYHASLTFLGQFIDVLGMYLATTFMLVYAWSRLCGLRMRSAALLYLALNLVLSLGLVYVPETRRFVFAIVLVVALVFEFVYLRTGRTAINSRWLGYGLLLFASAYAIWILDNERMLTAPQSVVQGHAIWHLLGAIATLYLYAYYRSERWQQTSLKNGDI